MAYKAIYRLNDANDTLGVNNLTQTNGSFVVGCGYVTTANNQYLRKNGMTSFITGNNDFTVMARYRIDTYAAYGVWVSYGVDDTTNHCWFGPLQDGSATGKLCAFFGGGSGHGDTFTDQIPALGKWFTAVYSYDKSNARFYYNGVKLKTTPYSSASITDSYFNIVKHPNSTSNGSIGGIKDVYVDDTAMGDQRLKTLSAHMLGQLQ